MQVKACVRSGECCKTRPCGFGEWDPIKSQCVYLAGNKPGDYSCGLYGEIIKDPTHHISPAFGAGCCRTLFNDLRKQVITEKYQGVEQLISVDWSF